MNNLNLFNIYNNLLDLKKGKCLISEPFSDDQYFKRSVVFITEHNEKSTMGFIINKPLPVNVNTFFPNIQEFDAECFLGGPVNGNAIYYIHTRPDLLEGSIHICNNLFLGGNINDLENSIISSNIKSSDIIFFVGYSGWTSNQLKEEFEKKYWVVSDINPNLIMNHTKDIWRQLLLDNKLIGCNIWANAPKNPILN